MNARPARWRGRCLLTGDPAARPWAGSRTPAVAARRRVPRPSRPAPLRAVRRDPFRLCVRNVLLGGGPETPPRPPPSLGQPPTPHELGKAGPPRAPGASPAHPALPEPRCGCPGGAPRPPALSHPRGGPAGLPPSRSEAGERAGRPAGPLRGSARPFPPPRGPGRSPPGVRCLENHEALWVFIIDCRRHRRGPSGRRTSVVPVPCPDYTRRARNSAAWGRHLGRAWPLPPRGPRGRQARASLPARSTWTCARPPLLRAPRSLDPCSRRRGGGTLSWVCLPLSSHARVTRPISSTAFPGHPLPPGGEGPAVCVLTGVGGPGAWGACGVSGRGPWGATQAALGFGAAGWALTPAGRTAGWGRPPRCLRRHRLLLIFENF